MEQRTCQICGNTEAYIKEYTKVIELKGRTLKIHHYKVTQCDVCNESVAEPESLKRSEPLIRNFYNQRTI